MSRFEIDPDTREPYRQGMPDQAPQFRPTLVQAVADEPHSDYHPEERKRQEDGNRGPDDKPGSGQGT